MSNKTLPTLNEESQISGVVCGIDEAGRGPLIGSVVAASCIIDVNNIPTGINDSKTLSEKKREDMYKEIIANCKFGIGIASVEEIDEINILHATMLAMQRSYTDLKQDCNTALIDGNRCPKLPCQAKAIVKGDSKSLSIAAASIIAKVTRDRLVHSLAEEFPQYGWANNKGYGTKEHLLALEKYGATKYHRRSFAPVRRALEAA